MEETSTTSNRGQRLKSGEIKKKPAGRGPYNQNFRVEIANTYKNDGYVWKKYAQTKILHAKFLRYYYRCAHEGCGALRHVQKMEDGSERFHITYAGSHTCQNRRWLFGSDMEKEGLTEGRKSQQPDSSSKRRKLVKAASNVVVNISSENSHESPVEKDDAAVQSSHDTCPCTGNVVLQKRSARRRRKKIVYSESGESSDRHSGNIVPKASVPAGKRRCAKEISFLESDESDLQVLDRIKCLPELVTSWYERKANREARLHDMIARCRVRMTHQAAKNAKLAKIVRKLKKTGTLEKGQEAIQMLDKNAKVVEALQKELENARVQIQSVEHAYEKLKQEHERVSSERQWLIQEGFEYVINRLHRSQEYLEPLGAVQTNLWESGAHYGLVQSYESCKDGVALKDASLYNPGAHEKFLKAVHELEHTRFPYIVELSQCGERSLDDLRAVEPIGLEKDGDEDAVTAGGSGD
ncbi:putative transcription factor WRKY family [Helianthus debilis subsp. tardiflorus]